MIRRLSLGFALLVLLVASQADAHRRHHWSSWDPWLWEPHVRAPSPAILGWAVVDLDVSPEEAEVWLDGERIGVADDFDGFPDYLYLRPGSYSLELRLEGYDGWTRQLRIRSGRWYEVDEALDPESGNDDAEEPSAPEDDVEPRRERPHQDRYFEPKSDDDDDASFDEPTESADDDDEAIEAEEPVETVAPEADSATLESGLALEVEPADAAVYIDGKQVEPSAEARLSLAPGDHEILVLSPGFRSRIVHIDADDGEPIELRIRLEPIEEE